jgi:hypothetical protein
MHAPRAVLIAIALAVVVPACSQPAKTFELLGLICLHDLYEQEIGDFAADYVGYETKDEAVEHYVEFQASLMKPHPGDLSFDGFIPDGAVFISEDSRPVLILQLDNLGNGWAVAGFRKCGPDG